MEDCHLAPLRAGVRLRQLSDHRLDHLLFQRAYSQRDPAAGSSLQQVQTSQAEDRKRASDRIQRTEWKGEERESRGADRECVLPRGWCEDAWTSTIAPERPRFPFLLPRSATPSDPTLRPRAGRSDVMRVHKRASFLDGFLLQPRHVYRWDESTS